MKSWEEGLDLMFGTAAMPHVLMRAILVGTLSSLVLIYLSPTREKSADGTFQEM
jgi:hypothetical protein